MIEATQLVKSIDPDQRASGTDRQDVIGVIMLTLVKLTAHQREKITEWSEGQTLLHHDAGIGPLNLLWAGDNHRWRNLSGQEEVFECVG